MGVNMWEFLNSNLFQTAAILIAGFFGFRIYNLQVKAKMKDAAVIICLEIESIMNAINNIKLLSSNEDIFQTAPIYQRLYWYDYRNLFIRKIGKDNVDLINKFYSQVIICEEARALFQSNVLLNRNAKTTAIQEQISIILKNYARKSSDYSDKTVDEQRSFEKEVRENLSRFEQLFNYSTPDFINNSTIWRYERAFSQYKDIEPIAYQKIKELAGII